MVERERVLVFLLFVLHVSVLHVRIESRSVCELRVAYKYGWLRPCNADWFFLNRESIKLQKTFHVEGHQISSSLLIREDFVAAVRGVDSIYLTQVFVLTVLHLCSTGISCCC